MTQTPEPGGCQAMHDGEQCAYVTHGPESMHSFEGTRRNLAPQCGNAAHPDGPWHTTQPVPFSWQLITRARRAIRRSRWGCGCPARRTHDHTTRGNHA